jgi:hypothetical protein
MEWFVFWLIVNCIVGYLIGKPKNDVGTAITVSILLGPIGWLIAALSKGNLRKCPNCAEFVKPEAKICHHCRSELPKPPTSQPHPPTSQPQTFLPKSKREGIALVVFFAAIFIGVLVVIFWAYSQNKATTKARDALVRENARADTYLRVLKLSPSPSAPAPRVTSSLPVATPTVAPPAADPESVTLVTAVNIPVGNYGFSTLQAGTHVKFISRNGENVRIRYMDADYDIPISATTEQQAPVK